MNYEILARYAPLYVDAAILTLKIAAIGIVGSLALGLLVAAIRHYRIPVATQIAAAYVELSRNTPLLVQLFFIYFGLPRVGVKWSGETCAIVGLIFLGGAYMAEALGSTRSPPSSGSPRRRSASRAPRHCATSPSLRPS